MAKDIGRFFGVGVGPGDPDLITRKAERVLKSVDWIFYPLSRRTGDSFVRGIVEPLGLPESKFRAVSLCMARDRQGDREAYDEAVNEIIGELERGKSAAWITEGDPLFYSTFCHVYETLRQRFPEASIEVVPGVTSIVAAAARAGVPVSNLDERVAVVPAAYGLEQLPSLLADFATVFLVKVHSVFDQLVDRLREMPDVNAIYLEKVGTPEERIVPDIASLRGQELSYFSLVILQARRR